LLGFVHVSCWVGKRRAINARDFLFAKLHRAFPSRRFLHEVKHLYLSSYRHFQSYIVTFIQNPEYYSSHVSIYFVLIYSLILHS
jgi:hypothetical protein